MDIFKRREEEKPAKTYVDEQTKNVNEGEAIIIQMEIFDKMIKTRIRLQKLMQSAALLPKYAKMNEFESRSGDQSQMVCTIFHLKLISLKIHYCDILFLRAHLFKCSET